MRKRFFIRCMIFTWGLSPLMLHALTLPLVKEDSVVGKIEVTHSHMGETLVEVGKRFDIGAIQIKEANPSLQTKVPLHIGTKVVIPSQFILPDAERTDLVINLAEQRLYFYPSDEDVVITEPVGIGRSGYWKTPEGQTKITKKVIDPFWYPTADVRTEAAKNGTPIPWKFPPGPNNPLGRHILRLGWASYLIHSTNQPESVGGFVSAGCIRMQPKGIENIFDRVEAGMQVLVINEPTKVGWKQGKLYLESHNSLNYIKIKKDSLNASVVSMLGPMIEDMDNAWVNWTLVKDIMGLNSGIPQIIGNRI